MKNWLRQVTVRVAIAAMGWLVLTASVNPEPLKPEKERLLVFGQEAFFEPREADEGQPFGRYPKLDSGIAIEPWRFTAVGSSYELATFSGSVWEYKLTFAFRRLPGYRKVIIGQYAVDPKRIAPHSVEDLDEDDLTRYFVLQYARNGDFIGYRDFLFSDEHCNVIGKARLARLGLTADEIRGCKVHSWQQVEDLARAYLRMRPSPLGVLHRIDRKTAESQGH